MKKIIVFVTLLAIMLTCATLAINAEDVDEYEDFYSASDVDAVDEAPITAEMVKDFIIENLDKICASIAAITSFVLAFIYKKGLFPFISKIFNQLGNALSATKDGLTKVVDENRKDILKGVGVINVMAEKFSDMSDKFAELQKLYEAQKANNAKLEAKVKRSDEINLLLCDMIKNIFVNTNMAQYLKDEMNTTYAECISRIKALEAEAVTNNENVA